MKSAVLAQIVPVEMIQLNRNPGSSSALPVIICSFGTRGPGRETRTGLQGHCCLHRYEIPQAIMYLYMNELWRDPDVLSTSAECQ